MPELETDQPTPAIPQLADLGADNPSLGPSLADDFQKSMDEWSAPASPRSTGIPGLEFLDAWENPKPDKMAAQEARLNSARREMERQPVKQLFGTSAEDVVLNSIPGISSLLTYERKKGLGEAQNRYARGEATDEDLQAIARAQQQAARDQSQGTFGQIKTGVLQAPAIIGESLAAGPLGRIGGLAAKAESGGTALARIGAAAGSQVAKTPLMPSLWLAQSQDRANQNGGNAWDPSNLAPALAYGALQNAVLGQIGKVTGNMGLGGRAGVGAVAMPLEQQGIDTITGLVDQALPEKWKFGTKFGVLGDLARGETDKALSHAVAQAALGAGFAAFHGNEAKPVEQLVDLVNAYETPKDAGKAAEAVATPVLDAVKRNDPATAQPFVEALPKDSPAEQYASELFDSVQSKASTPESPGRVSEIPGKPAPPPQMGETPNRPGSIEEARQQLLAQRPDLAEGASPMAGIQRPARIQPPAPPRVEPLLPTKDELKLLMPSLGFKTQKQAVEWFNDPKTQFAANEMLAALRGVKNPIPRPAPKAKPPEPPEAIKPPEQVPEPAAPEAPAEQPIAQQPQPQEPAAAPAAAPEPALHPMQVEPYKPPPPPKGEIRLANGEALTKGSPMNPAEKFALSKFGEGNVFRIAIHGSDGQKVGSVTLAASGDTVHVPWIGAEGLGGGEGRGAAQPFGHREMLSLAKEIVRLDPQAKRLVYTPAEGRIRAGQEREFDLEKLRQKMDRAQLEQGNHPVQKEVQDVAGELVQRGIDPGLIEEAVNREQERGHALGQSRNAEAAEAQPAEAAGEEPRAGAAKAPAGNDINPNAEPGEEAPVGPKDLFGKLLPKQFTNKKGSQPTLEDFVRENVERKAPEMGKAEDLPTSDVGMFKKANLIEAQGENPDLANGKLPPGWEDISHEMPPGYRERGHRWVRDPSGHEFAVGPDGEMSLGRQLPFIHELEDARLVSNEVRKLIADIDKGIVTNKEVAELLDDLRTMPKAKIDDVVALLDIAGKFPTKDKAIRAVSAVIESQRGARVAAEEAGGPKPARIGPRKQSQAQLNNLKQNQGQSLAAKLGKAGLSRSGAESLGLDVGAMKESGIKFSKQGRDIEDVIPELLRSGDLDPNRQDVHLHDQLREKLERGAQSVEGIERGIEKKHLDSLRRDQEAADQMQAKGIEDFFHEDGLPPPPIGSEGEFGGYFGNPQGRRFETMNPRERQFALAKDKADLERAQDKLSPLLSEYRRRNEQAWNAASNRLAKDPDAGRKLVDELLAKDRPVSQDEGALLLLSKVSINNRTHQAVTELNRLVGSFVPDGAGGRKRQATDSQVEAAKRAVDDAIAERNRLDLAVRKAGSNLGAGLQFYKQLAKADYSLAGMLAMAKAKYQRDITPKEVEYITELERKNRELEERLEMHDAPEPAEPKSGAWDRVKSFFADLFKPAASRPKSKGWETLDKIEKEAFAELNQKLGLNGERLFSGLDPTILVPITKYAAAKIGKGALDFAQFSEGMIKRFGDAARPHLVGVWQAAKKMAEEAKKDPLDLRIEQSKVRKQYQDFLDKGERENMSLGAKAVDRVRQTGNALRAIQTSLDLSATLRQGAFLAASHPIKSTKAFIGSLADFASERNYDRAMTEIIQRYNGGLYKDAGLEFTGEHAYTKAMEESYMGRWISKIPGVKASERAFTGYLNRIRADLFDSMVGTMSRNGVPTPKEAQAVANFINVASGRGKMPESMSKVTKYLADWLYSPRYLVSRFQLLAGQPLYSGTARTRRLVAAEYAKTALGAAVFYAVAQNLLDGQVTWDPRSADFGKIRMGNVRLDPLAGLAQATVFLNRLITGETKSTAGGGVHDLRGKTFGLESPTRPPHGKESEMADVIASFARSKLAPLPGLALDFVVGKDVVGKPVNEGEFYGYKDKGRGGIALRIAADATPLGLRDTYEALSNLAPEKGVPAAVLAILGMGIQAYDRKPTGPR